MKKLIKSAKKSILNLPTPTNISYLWNYGSLLGLLLAIQIISGMILSMHYCPNISMAFNSIMHIIQNVKNGWLTHNIHMNGATFFFMFMYMHIGRGLYYQSYKLSQTWVMGTLILFASMATAFLGYVLPWGQMSFWGATVITNLISTIPYMGNMMVMWVWGGFSINNATLNRFFSLHFILPFLIMVMIISHLYFLHITGSSNPLGTNSNLNKIPFHIYFTFKDLLGFMMFFIMFIIIILQYPYMFSDPDNFTSANPMVTPIHIQPEWYFLFAYTILRSIPNKLGGVIALTMSISILLILPMLNKNSFPSSFNPPLQMSFWIIVNVFILLTWAGAKPIEFPYINMGQNLTVIYFSYFIMIPAINKMYNYLNK